MTKRSWLIIMLVIVALLGVWYWWLWYDGNVDGPFRESPNNPNKPAQFR
jgi:uncharacterized membrane protein YdfJ with MMPL/SSD domain